MGYRGAVFDVDGTVVRGDDPLPGAVEGVERVRAAGIPTLFVSNNPTKPPAAYVDRLSRAGFETTADRVITAGTVAVDYLDATRPDDRLYLIGEEGVRRQLRDAGLTLTDDPDAAEALVVSIDRDFDYEDLCAGLWALRRDVPFIGTDPDVVIPAADRDVPGSGAIIRAVAGVAEREPNIVLGKPSEPALEAVRDRLGVPPGDCFVVGDRLDTDIALGARAGMTTVLVRTGITDTVLEDAPVEPDYVLDTLAEIDRVLDDAPD
jgi:4-nitrophenyl phosphatase